MRIDQWWPLLQPATAEWLVSNNGDVVPPHVLEQIVAVAGPAVAGASWVGEDGTDGFTLSDEAVDWIEAAGNGEVHQAGR